MFEIKNNEKIKKESSLVQRKSERQAIFKFDLSSASGGAGGGKYNRIPAFVSMHVLLIRRSLEKFFQKNFRDDTLLCFGFAKVKILSFLSRCCASANQGISTTASCREAHKRRFILNPWILRFAYAQPLKMTIIICFVLSLGVVSEAMAATCAWEKDADGNDTTKLVVSGTGTVNKTDCPNNYLATATKLEIKKGVTGIGNNAFDHNKGLTSVKLPENLTRIGIFSFAECKNLTLVELPNSLERIDGYAFRMSGLTSITIPENVKYIGGGALNSTKIKTLTIPDSVEVISGSFLWGTASIEEIIIPDTFNPSNSGDFLLKSQNKYVPKIICQGDIQKCKENMKHYQTADGEVDMSAYVFAPEDDTQCTNKYVWDDRTGKCNRMTENQCNMSRKYYFDGTTCATRKTNGKITCTNPSYKENDGYCDRIRYTPVEAAEVLHDDNTNEVTITFKK